MNKVAYIAGPYRGATIYDTMQNIRFAEKYALKYWLMGYTVICPHKNTAFFDGACEDHVWLEGALELLRRSDLVVMIPGSTESDGATREHLEAKELGKEILYES